MIELNKNKDKVLEETGVSATFSPMSISDADFRRMLDFIKSSYGIDLSQKKQLITGRLSPAIRKLGYKSFSEFVNHLLETRYAALYHVILGVVCASTLLIKQHTVLDVAAGLTLSALAALPIYLLPYQARVKKPA